MRVAQHGPPNKLADDYSEPHGPYGTSLFCDSSTLDKASSDVSNGAVEPAVSKGRGVQIRRGGRASLRAYLKQTNGSELMHSFGVVQWSSGSVNVLLMEAVDVRWKQDCSMPWRPHEPITTMGQEEYTIRASCTQDKTSTDGGTKRR